LGTNPYHGFEPIRIADFSGRDLNRLFKSLSRRIYSKL